MTDPNVISLIIRLITGSAAAFFAIFLWAKTRDTAWMLVIIGIIVDYAKILFSALQFFGFVSPNLFTIGELKIGKIILDNIPSMFISAGLIIMILRHRYK